MNGLHLVSSPSINSFKVDGRKTKKWPQPDITHSSKPRRARSFSGPHLQHQFRKRTTANKITKFNDTSNSLSFHCSNTCSDSSAVMSKGANTTNPSAMFIDCSEEDKSRKRNSQKRARKKGKYKKKQLCDVGFLQSEICSQYTHGSSPPGMCGNNDMNCGIVVSNVTSPEVSLSDGSLNVTDFVDCSNCVVSNSDSTNICTADIYEVEAPESIVPSQVQKFPLEHHINNSEIGSEDQQLSSYQRDADRSYPASKGSPEGLHQKDLSDMHDFLVLDSVSVGSNGKDSKTAGHIVKPFKDNNHERSQSELPASVTKNESLYRQNSLCSTSENLDYTEGTKHGLAGSRSDGQVVASGKKGKQFKSIPGNSSTCKLGSIGNLRNRTGTESSHSVWQRVQKNAVEKCNAEKKKTSPTYSQFDVILKDSPLLKRNSNTASAITLSTTDHKRKSKTKVPKKMKTKVSPASKQENIGYFRKESHSNKVNLNADANASLPKSNMLDALTSLGGHRAMTNLSRSSSQVGCAMDDSVQSESVNNSQAGPSNAELNENVCGTASGLNSICIENQNSLLQKPCVTLDLPNSLEVQTPVYLPHLMVNSVPQMEKKISHAENGKQGHNLGSILQKWMPIGIKDPGMITSARSANLSLEQSNVPEAEDWTFKSTFEEKVAPNSQSLSSSVNSGKPCRIGKDSKHAISCLENGNCIQRLRNGKAYINESEDKHNGANFLNDETKEQNLSSVAVDLNKIEKALNDAYQAQMASEALQIATGGPIAEFERLLHFCSPVICHSYCSLGCKTCLLDRVPGAQLGRHETPNIPLGCLWKWYEKHGSYGLEIKAEDYKNPKRLGIDQFKFRAYFVPYLSAIQLFRNNKSHSTQNGNNIISPQVSKTSDTASTSRNSTNVSHPPIFSVLVAQPCIAEANSQFQENDVVGTESSPVSPKNVLPVRSDDMTRSDHLELVFEYFEFEQPHRRQALYEKIQDLVRDDIPPQCKMYGDPAYLNSINMHDLHPQSWYSVAWYPIYRIPDGNLRAAFLTYHSLGHFVHRSSTFDYSSVGACTVSPVVGLQSYNAQGECWFQPGYSTMNCTSEPQGLSPSGILKERLRTLEETASLMARAVVNKGNQTSVNRHPDYEFFLSRQR